VEKIVRVGIGVFVWKDGKFLMGKRYGSHGHDTWSIPGGHLEFDETIKQGAAREVKEETGMLVNNVRFLTMTEDFFPDKNKHYLTVWVDSDWVSGEPTITEPEISEYLEWYDFSTLPSPLFEPCWQNLRKAKPELFIAR